LRRFPAAFFNSILYFKCMQSPRSITCFITPGMRARREAKEKVPGANLKGLYIRTQIQPQDATKFNCIRCKRVKKTERNRVAPLLTIKQVSLIILFRPRVIAACQFAVTRFLTIQLFRNDQRPDRKTTK